MSQLNLIEKSIKVLGAIVSSPVFMACLCSVPANNTRLVYRFGKFDRQVERGLRYIPPFAELFDIFTNTTCVQHKNLNLLDKNGNPIIISSNVSMRINSPRTYLEKTNFFKV